MVKSVDFNTNGDIIAPQELVDKLSREKERCKNVAQTPLDEVKALAAKLKRVGRYKGGNSYAGAIELNLWVAKNATALACELLTGDKIIADNENKRQVLARYEKEFGEIKKIGVNFTLI